MRILHAIDLFQPVGGAQTYARRLIELQAEAGHEVAVVHSDPEATAPAGSQALHAEDTASIRSFINDVDPDVIHAHDWSLAADVEAEIALERPLVRSLHNLSFACSTGTRYFRDGTLCTRAHGSGCLVAAVARGCAHRLDPRPVVAEYRQIETLLPRLRSTPFTILHSEYMKSLAVSNGVLRARCAAVPYFAEPPDDTEPMGDGRVVCFVGRTVRNKGLDLLLRALALVPDAWDQLVVAGDGWDVPNCKALSSQLGIAEKVAFVGWTDRKRTLDIIQRSRVLAMPSRWPEPFGIVGIEAMALGRPVVAIRSGGIPEWLDEGETGLLVPPGDINGFADALSTVLADRGLAERLGDEGRRRVGRFSPEAHLASLERIYTTVITPHDAGAREVAAR